MDNTEIKFYFPDFNEEGTIDEIFRNVRNGYYDNNTKALETFEDFFKQQNKGHEAKFTKMNKEYCISDSEMTKRFCVLVMDVEDHLAGHKHPYNDICMEEFEEDGLVVNASYNTATGKYTVAVDETKVDDNGMFTRRCGVNVFTYDEFSGINGDGFERIVNEILFYAVETED